MGSLLRDVGAQQGLLYLRRALITLEFLAPTLSASRSFDPLWSDPRFEVILAEAHLRRQQALAAFREARDSGSWAGDARQPMARTARDSVACCAPSSLSMR